MAGEGKNYYAKYISTTGNSLGDLTGPIEKVSNMHLINTKPPKLAMGCVNNDLVIAEGVPLKTKKTHKSHKNFVNGVSISPDGTRIASAGNDKTIIISSTNDLKLIK